MVHTGICIYCTYAYCVAPRFRRAAGVAPKTIPVRVYQVWFSICIPIMAQGTLCSVHISMRCSVYYLRARFSVSPVAVGRSHSQAKESPNFNALTVDWTYACRVRTGRQLKIYPFEARTRYGMCYCDLHLFSLLEHIAPD